MASQYDKSRPYDKTKTYDGSEATASESVPRFAGGGGGRRRLDDIKPDPRRREWERLQAQIRAEDEELLAFSANAVAALMQEGSLWEA